MIKPSKFDKAFGAILREERHRKGWDLWQVAQQAGLSVGYLSEIERGRKHAAFHYWGEIGSALGLTEATLLRKVADRLEQSEQPQASRAFDRFLESMR
ncbi:helix-turn-helix transcriptional regulator [Bifidobacterium sp. SO1]|uniref:helix-turn-helix domain-containing protein n=1 Tax=Bifidobacterium sp. SO1 TaxID=2809029 RepID=UPI001BDBC26D|nr:helix-turn-helix transcriptional regulator [Bifidobacterium sp. SO1]MBT1162223.1 helix-turn-helix transcriptional regulator [Bifidobacterium sp. SO1]